MNASMDTMHPVMIMAGGTGGHVYPALAVADALRGAGVPVVWLGTRSGIEARVVPAAGIDMEWLDVSGLRGRGALAWLWAPLRLARALFQSFSAIRRRRPAVLLGMGGFVAGPGGVAGWLLDLPLVIHEQNARAGLTNRLQAHWASAVLQAFPESHSWPGSARTVGNPVRTDIAALPAPERRFADRGGPVRLLVLGGSQGARALNSLIPAALAEMGPGLELEVRHQAGDRGLEDARRAYERAALPEAVHADVSPFIEDMAGAYAWADLVVCRAGALTVSEIAAAGLGAVLIPFPHAVDDHQTANACWLQALGGGIVLPESELDAVSLAQVLLPLLADRGRCLYMAAASRGGARPQAAEDVARVCMGLHADSRRGVAA